VQHNGTSTARGGVKGKANFHRIKLKGGYKGVGGAVRSGRIFISSGPIKGRYNKNKNNSTEDNPFLSSVTILDDRTWDNNEEGNETPLGRGGDVGDGEDEEDEEDEEMFEVTEEEEVGGELVVSTRRLHQRTKKEEEMGEEGMSEILKREFGFGGFRAGQKEAVSRILSGKSTLLIIPTGSGKSLTYQLPAFLLAGPSTGKVVLVVSPLLSLMFDQMRNLPKCLRGACLSHEQSPEESERIYGRLRKNELHVLFVSPERATSETFLRLWKSEEGGGGGGMPGIAFGCIDEAHCLSEWSHNFRPAYLHLGQVLKNTLGVSCILALTATATKITQLDIASALDIPTGLLEGRQKVAEEEEENENGVIRTSCIRRDMMLTVSQDLDAYKSLLTLLRSTRFSGCVSGEEGRVNPRELPPTIVYVMLQKQADEVAAFLQAHGYNASSYHAGKSSGERKRVQSMFNENQISLVVATVAFGMGIDKRDLRSVIHFSLPRSLENYVQEVGRSGRDANPERPAQCHLFLSIDDYLRMLSLAHSDSIDEVTVKKLLIKIFSKTTISSKSSTSPSVPYHSVISIAGIEEGLDIKKEVVSTVLSFLELHPVGYLKQLPHIRGRGWLRFHGTEQKVLVKRNALIAAALKDSKASYGKHYFNLLSVCELLGRDITPKQSGGEGGLVEVEEELTRLQTGGEISYELEDPSFLVRVLVNPSDLLTLTEECVAKLRQFEALRVEKLNFIFKTMTSVAFPSIQDMLQNTNNSSLDSSSSSSSSSAEEKCSQLHSLIDSYFSLDEEALRLKSSHPPQVLEPLSNTTRMSLVRSDLRVLLNRMESMLGGRSGGGGLGLLLSGRTLAKILHGLPSSSSLAQHNSLPREFFGRHRSIEFDHLVSLASEELLNHLHRGQQTATTTSSTNTTRGATGGGEERSRRKRTSKRGETQGSQDSQETEGDEE
jgi:ATP-dependent DNA helicase Q4